MCYAVVNKSMQQFDGKEVEQDIDRIRKSSKDNKFDKERSKSESFAADSSNSAEAPDRQVIVAGVPQD